MKYVLTIHKLVKYPQPIHCIENGGKPLQQNITLKQREELEAKMTEVFRGNIQTLSTELQKILIDDLVTAFQNRINVLIRVQRKTSH